MRSFLFVAHTANATIGHKRNDAEQRLPLGGKLSAELTDEGFVNFVCNCILPLIRRGKPRHLPTPTPKTTSVLGDPGLGGRLFRNQRNISVQKIINIEKFLERARESLFLKRGARTIFAKTLSHYIPKSGSHTIFPKNPLAYAMINVLQCI